MSREIRILHTADTHLGYRQYHSEVRRQDFFSAFETVIKDAIEMQVDAVVHAGDFFDSRNPTLEDLLEAINILSGLKAAGIPFLAIVGNHESKQNTQWLDLFEEMGVACRLGKKACMVGDAALYGIDSVPKSKIPTFDYSDFEVPEQLPEGGKNLLVMHQIMQPFPYGEWSCEEVLENLPFKVDAVLLGDYHKYEKIKVGETWVTYPGSTERNSSSESEPRSYNIVTLSESGLEISRRTIPTRDFLFIPVNLNGQEKPYEQIFGAVDEYQETLPDSVVFLDISGDPTAVLSFSEIEEYLLNKGALVPRVRDLRVKEAVPEEVLKVSFSDPDHAVAEEIKRMSLTDGGLIVDEIVRNPNVVRSRVDEETENRLVDLISAIDFKDPGFKIELPAPEPVPGGFEVPEKEDSGKTEVPEIESEFAYPEIPENPEGSEIAEVSEIARVPEPVELAEVLESPEPAVLSELSVPSEPSEPSLPSELSLPSDEVALSEVNEVPESIEVPEPVEASESVDSPEPVENLEEPEVSMESEVPEKSEVSENPGVSEESEFSEEPEVSEETEVSENPGVSEESGVPIESEVSEHVDLPNASENVPPEKEMKTPEKEERDESPVFWKPPASSGVGKASSEQPSGDGSGEENPFMAFESSGNKSKGTPGRGLDSFIMGEAGAKGRPDSGNDLGNDSGKGSEDDSVDKAVKGKLPDEGPGNKEESPEDAGKSAKSGKEKDKEKGKGKGKPSALRQYNLGDYL